MKIKVNLKTSYEIKIKKGLIIENRIPEGFIVTDSNIAKIYKKLLYKEKLVIDAGEESKNLENYEKIILELSKVNEEAIIAFGGGVIGDLAGFVASTCKRGLNLIQVPTTLLAMVDSSIGGKNGVNLGELKNYAGTIYQPKKVLIDPLFLETLPNKEFKNGVAEIIKYSYIFGNPKLERLKKGVKKIDMDLENIVAECCEIKSRVVEEDEFDKGYRHTLNFGHTIGHAIELPYNLSHGEAISIGMIKELELGKKAGLVDGRKIKEIKEVLEINKLPTEFPENMDIDKVLRIMKTDKKGYFVFALDKNNYNVQLNEEIIKNFLKNEHPNRN